MKIMFRKVTLLPVIVAVVFVFPGAGTAQEVSVDDTLHLTLDKALEIALSENPLIKVADKEIEKVDYSRKEAWAGLIPSISAEGSYSRNVKKPVLFLSEDMAGGFGGSSTIEIGSDNSYSGAISAAMPLFNMSLFKSIRMTEVEMKSALESARQSRINMINEVKKAYYNCLLANDSYNVMLRSLENAKENYENTQKMFDQGAAAEYDVIRSEVQVRNLEPSLTEAKNGRKVSALMLKILLGLDRDIPLGFDENLEAFKELIEGMPSDPQQDISNNTDIRQLDIQKLQLDKQFELTRAQRFPTLSAFINYQFQTQANHFRFDDYRWATPIVAGLQLQIPIFSGFSKRYQEKQVEISMEQLKYQRENVERQVSVSVLNAYSSMEAAAQKIESARVAVRQAKRGYEISQTRYETGACTLLELNDAEVALTQARLNLNQARFDFLSARAEYEKTLGTNLPEFAELPASSDEARME
ncbi:TolC family protein [Anaerophaga thermohalophila]|uniref:TolC family protein n=1 Tax=Anaerophaga thermohalophila TaxID=177400 RepID=UPI0003005ED7|nr:TolC family protein [Anaerophaga thermohalophila]